MTTNSSGSGSCKRGVARLHPLLPLLLSYVLLVCGIGLFFVLAGAMASSSSQSGGTIARSSLVISNQRTGENPYTNGSISTVTSGSDTALANTAAELQEVLGSLQVQIKSLTDSLPSTIEQELKRHHTALQKVHKQAAQQQAQLPPLQPQQAVPGVQAPHVQVHHVSQAHSACDKRSGSGIKLAVSDTLVAPVVVVAHNRVHYLAKSLMTVLRYWQDDPANAERFPLFVSVDGGDQATMHFAAALNFGAQVQVIHNLRDSTRCQPKDGYCNLSVHYHMLLQLFFECHKAPRLIFLEEDLEIAPDFFGYFAAFAPLLDKDKSLMCVSAWNDHGQRGRAVNQTAVYRTDIFPGLGWMLTSEVGRELQSNWPNKYWDEYLRESKVRKGRQCIFPEVPRTHTFGKDGTSGGILFDQHLALMLLNKDRVDWSQQDIAQYEAATYAQHMITAVAAAQQLGQGDDLRAACDVKQPDYDKRGDMVVRYTDNRSFQAIAGQLAPMLGDLKGDPRQPRGSYMGVVTVRCRGRRLFVAPRPTNKTD